MSDSIDLEGLIEDIFPVIKNKISELKENREWKKLFIEAGDSFNEDKVHKEGLDSELEAAFSHKNMKKLASELKGESGYCLREKLYNHVANILIDYNIEPYLIDTYANHFLNFIFNYLEKNMPEKYQQDYLHEMREEGNRDAADIKGQLDIIVSAIKRYGEENRALFTISEINAQIRKETISPKIGIDFFEIDDEKFQNDFIKRLSQERVYIVGNSKEETLYCILNELMRLGFEKSTFVVKNEKTWNDIEGEHFSGKILIPFFNSNNILTIPDNTNIFIFSNDEPCYQKEKLVLHKRTRKTLISALKRAGQSDADAAGLIENTHGLYIPMKKHIFNGAYHENLSTWEKINQNILVTVLLCGQWRECERDKKVLEDLSGSSYEEIITEIRPYMSGEDPLLVEVKNRGGNSIQLTCVEDAWERLGNLVTEGKWGEYIALFYSTMIEVDPIFDIPRNDRYLGKAVIKESSPSNVLKHGMIRSLIMRGYCYNNKRAEAQTEEIIRRILLTISSKREWEYFSQYFCDLCEASPSAVLERMEDELQNPTGLKELFEDSSGDIIRGENYYTEILWAAEELLLQEAYAVRSVKWLLAVNDYDINYKISNSPRETLEKVFCAWINLSAITPEGKTRLAEPAVKKYKKAWDIFYSELPGVSTTVIGTLYTPKYRATDEIADLSDDEISRTFDEYIRVCFREAGFSSDRWLKLISEMSEFDGESLDDAFAQLLTDIKGMNDKDCTLVKEKLRSEIYRHRFYANSDWAMDENRVQKFEFAMNSIQVENPVYDYLYIFKKEYSTGVEFPLLHPVPYDAKKSNDHVWKQNVKLQEAVVKEEMEDFKQKGLSLYELLKLINEDMSPKAGEYIARYYDNCIFHPETVEIMMQSDPKGNLLVQYVEYLSRGNREVILKAIDVIGRDDSDLIVKLLSCEQITNGENSLIANETDEIKTLYWSKPQRFLLTDKEIICWSIRECKKYGALNTYIAILFSAKDVLSAEELYSAFLEITELRVDRADSSTQYFLQEVLKPLQKQYITDSKKCFNIATIELKFRGILNWEDMTCLLKEMKESPDIYAQMADVIFKKDGESKEDNEGKDKAKSIFSLYYEAKFCPAEADGRVNYNDLKRWADKFRDLLSEQNQRSLFGYLMGRLLANSPVGDDNYYPCEAVRQLIEEVYDEDLKNAYENAVINSRGIFTPDAGKTEMEMSYSFRENADHIRICYPNTAKIYDALSSHYEYDSEEERRRAEDER